MLSNGGIGSDSGKYSSADCWRRDHDAAVRLHRPLPEKMPFIGDVEPENPPGGYQWLVPRCHQMYDYLGTLVFFFAFVGRWGWNSFASCHENPGIG